MSRASIMTLQKEETRIRKLVGKRYSQKATANAKKHDDRRKSVLQLYMEARDEIWEEHPPKTKGEAARRAETLAREARMREAGDGR